MRTLKSTKYLSQNLPGCLPRPKISGGGSGSGIGSKTLTVLLAATFCAPAVYFASRAEAQDAAATKDEPQDDSDRRAELERRFEESLTGATLVGHFTVTGDSNKLEPKAERYTLKRVKKVAGDRWLFLAQIRYGKHDVLVPLTLPVKWAGDTPVITVDDISVPTLGTFQARVLIYKDHYAGFWRGAGHGGHLFGVIERDAKSKNRD